LVAATSASAVPTIPYPTALKPIPYPGDTFTEVLSINNQFFPTVVGFHGATVPQGFVANFGPLTFTPQNFPGSVTSMVTGINNAGSTSGAYVDTAGTSHGYTDIGGSFATVDEPGTVFNQALGINDASTTVGYASATDPTGHTGEVAYRQAAGAFTDLVLPANVNSQAVGINDAGAIVGFYQPTSTTSLGFLDVGGAITTLDPFGSSFVRALGIGQGGLIVGSWVDSMGATHGFFDIGGGFKSFDVAGASSSVVTGVANGGFDFVGYYVDASTHDTVGFIAAYAPEPATWTLMLVGFGGLGAALRSRRAQATSA
jgi:hypothetical protein